MVATETPLLAPAIAFGQRAGSEKTLGAEDVLEQHLGMVSPWLDYVRIWSEFLEAGGAQDEKGAVDSASPSTHSRQVLRVWLVGRLYS